MPDIIKTVYLLVGVFLLLGLLANIGGFFPKLPGDIDIDKPGIKLYIPFTSAIVISVILTLLFNFFRK